MYVEDLLLAIRDHVYFVPNHAFDGLLTDWHRNFVTNVSTHVEAGRQLSTNQSAAILKLIAKVRRQIVRYGLATEADIDHLLRHPDYRRPLYESPNIPREVRYLGDNVLGFRFKQNDVIAAQIRDFGRPASTDWASDWAKLRKMTDLLPRPQFNWQHRIWIVPVLRYNLSRIVRLINEYRFDVDPATTAYLRLARDSQDRPSAFTMTDEVILGNVCDNPLLAGWITSVSDGVIL
jgi:hypothetical protein